MRHQQYGAPPGSKLADLAPEEAAPERVDVVGRFVEDDQSARAHRGHAEPDEALDSAGQLLAKNVAPFPDVQSFDEDIGADGYILSPSALMRPASSIASRARKASTGMGAGQVGAKLASRGRGRHEVEPPQGVRPDVGVMRPIVADQRGFPAPFGPSRP